MIVIATAPRSHRAPPEILRSLGLLLLVAPFFLGALVCMALIDPACCDVGNDLSLLYLYVPWLLLACAYTARYWHWMSKGKSIGYSLVAVAAISLLLAGFTGPYVYMANALSGNRPVHYEGFVTGKWYTRGRSSTYAMVLRDEALARKVSIRISKPDFDALKAGDRAACDFLVGGFGIAYRWRLASGPDCTFRRG